MQGGIYNAALFGASQRKPRPARDKVNRMGGILASSPELMAASAPAPAQAPSLGAGPMPTPQMPLQPSLPTQVPPQPAQPMAQAPQQPAPSAPAPAPQAPQPVKMQEGGPVDVGEVPKISTKNALLMSLMAVPGLQMVVPKLISKFGGQDEAEAELKGKKAAVDAAVATGNEDNIATTIVDQADLPPTEEGKKEFARNVFGMEDVNDIDEINRRIANVAISGSIGKGNDEYVKALLLGLGEYKKTATARAAGTGAGGTKMSPLEPFADAVRDLAGKIMQSTGEDPDVAIQQARDALAPYYSGQTPTMTGNSTPASKPTLEQFLKAAQPQNPNASVEDLTKYYNDTYGG